MDDRLLFGFLLFFYRSIWQMSAFVLVIGIAGSLNGTAFAFQVTVTACLIFNFFFPCLSFRSFFFLPIYFSPYPTQKIRDAIHISSID